MLMRLALICMVGGKPAPEKKPSENCTPSTFLEDWQKLEMAHALAIGACLRQDDRLEPILICPKGSKLESLAKESSQPCIAISPSLNPVNLFGLWRWQKKQPWLPILVVGEEGIALGRRLAAMRKPGYGQLDGAFMLRPPKNARAKDIASFAHILGGSAFISEKIGETLQKNPAKGQNSPQIDLCLPGMDMRGYDFPPPTYDQEKDTENRRHFVFGMAGSLLPHSGALLVARAMSGIWQRTDLPPWEIRMFGGGPRFEEILREARLLGVESKLSLLSDQSLPDVTRLCHAWLAPSVKQEELPQNLWAGFAAGLPVICAQSQLHRERLQFAEGAAVLRVGEDNPQELAKAMIGVMRNARLRQHLVMAEAEITAHISLQAMAQRVRAHLEDWLPKEEIATPDEVSA